MSLKLKKSQKIIVNNDQIKEIIEDIWNALASKCKTINALLINLMFALALRTGKVKYLIFWRLRQSIHTNT